MDNQESNLDKLKGFLIGDEQEAEQAINQYPYAFEELQEVAYYKKPSVQLFAVLGVAIPIIWLVLAAFSDGSSSINASESPTIDEEKAKLVSALNEERQRIRQLELQNALYEQKIDVVPESKAKPKATAKTKPVPVQKVPAPPAPKPVVAKRKSQPVYRPAPKPVVAQRKPQPVYRPATKPVVAQRKPQPIPQPKPDPMQQWLAIASQGHYTTSNTSNVSTNQVKLVSKKDSVIPQARTKFTSKKSQTIASNKNVIDIGSSAKATLESAVVWTSNNTQSDRKYLLRLKQQFENIDGKVVLPEDTRLIAQVKEYSNSGLLSMEVVQILHQGQKINLPEGALIIEGKKGSPLKADLKQKGDSDFLSDLGSILAPGVERALDSASDTLIVQNGSVFRSNSRRDPLSSGAAGIADGVSQTLNRRLQNNPTQSIISYFQLDSGKTVYLKAYEDISF